MSFSESFGRKIGILDYLGSWNASTNTPTIESGVGKKNSYYIVSVAGTTAIDGIGDWNVGDWIIFNNRTLIWEKIDNSELVTSVAGKIGDVTLTSDDLTEGSNLFFTEERANKFAFTYEVHVSKDGVDSGSTGKPYQPFLTLAAAISYVESTFTGGEPIVIYIHPGSYYEAVTITRPRTYLIGVQSTTTVVTNISSVTFAPTTVSGGVYNSSFSLENLLLSGHSSTSAVVTMGGTVEYSLHIRNSYIFTDNANQKSLVVTNNSATKPRLYVNELLANNVLSGAIGLDLSNCVAQLKNLTVYSGTATCLKLAASASALGGFLFLETSGTLAIELGATTLTVATSSIAASGSNASGVSIAAGGTYTSIQNFYNVASGTGYAISGASGGIFTHALNAFAFGTNNKYKSALTVVAHQTSLTSAV